MEKLVRLKKSKEQNNDKNINNPTILKENVNEVQNLMEKLDS
jgi:hypothetical protein